MPNDINNIFFVRNQRKYYGKPTVQFHDPKTLMDQYRGCIQSLNNTIDFKEEEVRLDFNEDDDYKD